MSQNKPILINSKSLSEFIGGKKIPFGVESERLHIEYPEEKRIWLSHNFDDWNKIKKIPKSCKLVITLNQSVASLNQYDFTEEVIRYIINDYLSFVVDGEVRSQVELINSELDTNKYDSWGIIDDYNGNNTDRMYVKEFYQKLAEILNSKILNNNTVLKLNYLFFRNALINAPRISSGLLLDQFANICMDRPVLIVATGPSLNKQLNTLKQYQNSFLIVAVESAYSILEKNGISADVLVCIDPLNTGEWKTNTPLNTTRFLAEVGAGPKALWVQDSNLIFSSAYPESIKILEKLGVAVSYLATGGSVATSAFNFARLVGGNPIILIGQDLALSGGKDHAEGYPWKYSESELTHRTEAGFNVGGYDGGTVRTERQLLYYKNWYENTIATLENTMIFNCTEGGAKIKGCVQTPFRSLCEALPCLSDVKNIPRGFNASFSEIHIRSLIEKLEDFKQSIIDYRIMINSGIEILESNKGKSTDFLFEQIDSFNNSLKTVDSVFSQFVDAFSIFSIDRIKRSFTNRGSEDGVEAALVGYRSVYEETSKAADYAIKMLERISLFYHDLIDCGRLDHKLMEDLLNDSSMTVSVA